MSALDLADPANAFLWLAHPTVGEASFDGLVRHAANPVYRGAEPFLWPVNGVLVPGTSPDEQALYIGLYAKGYVPAPGGPNSQMLALVSHDSGRTWGNATTVCRGNASLYDRGGGTPDGSAVLDRQGGMHLVYDWGTPGALGHSSGDGGLGYAHSRAGALGPFTRSPQPLNSQRDTGVISPGYRRVYGGTLLRRAHTWLVLAAMSTAGNSGGMWGLCALTASSPRGPFGAPTLLLWPQSSVWHPHPCEFYPAFQHGDFAYAPCTSLAANRNYQVIYRAPLDRASEPGAWEVFRAGSAWHWEGAPHEAAGIWGQTFSAFVDAEGTMHAMYPSRDGNNVGNINLASRPWAAPLVAHGFWVSAPAADALALMQRGVGPGFSLNATVAWRGAAANFSLRWNHRGDIGQGGAGLGFAGMRLSPRCLHRSTSLRVDAAEGRWALEQVLEGGAVVPLAAGAVPEWEPGGDRTVRVVVNQAVVNGGEVRVKLGRAVVAEAVALPRDTELGGGLALHAAQGLALHATEFALSEQVSEQVSERAARSEHSPVSWFLLPGEGMAGAGNAGTNVSVLRDWAFVNGTAGRHFRAGEGFEHPGGSDLALAKFSFEGVGCRLWAPRGPRYGEATVSVDGEVPRRVTLRASAARRSEVVFEWRATPAVRARHALSLRWAAGAALPVDSLEFFPFDAPPVAPPLDAPRAWRPMLLPSACGGDASCLNCTAGEAEAKCVASLGCVALYELAPPPPSPPPARCAVPPAARRGDFALCSETLGPIAGPEHCFLCRGPEFFCS